MNLKTLVNKIMDFSAQHNTDINNSYIRMSHLISSGSITDISQIELDNAHKFVQSNYKLAVAARKGKRLKEYEEVLKEWQS